MGGMELSQRLDFGSVELAEEKEETFDKLASLIDAHFDVTPTHTTALTDSGLTSLDRVELAIRIEEAFGVRINESVYETCRTVGDLAEFIEEREGETANEGEAQ